MKAIGKVIEIKGNVATVSSKRQSACSSCHNCEAKGACHAELIFGEQQQTVVVNALNKIGAKTGDIVELESSTKFTLTLAVIIFIFPFLITALLYMFLKGLLLSAHYFPVLLICIFCISFYAVSMIINKLLKNKNTTTIVAIIEENQNLEAE